MKAFRALRILFLSNFLLFNFYFLGFPEKKNCEKSLPYVAPYMLRRMICMVKIFHILTTACIRRINRFFTNLIDSKAILRVFETNVCATYDWSFSIQIMHGCVWLRIIFYGGQLGYGPKIFVSAKFVYCFLIVFNGQKAKICKLRYLLEVFLYIISEVCTCKSRTRFFQNMHS